MRKARNTTGRATVCECGRPGATAGGNGQIIRGCPACEAADRRFADQLTAGIDERREEKRQIRRGFADVRRACDAWLAARGIPTATDRLLITEL